MDYKEKLIQFNSTDKYQAELRFLSGLLNGTSVLDYGCGIGTAVEYLKGRFKVHGYDKNNYLDHSPEWMVKEVKGLYDNIIFVHSLAHIENVWLIIWRLRDHLTDEGTITVITPNLPWIDKIGNTKSDTTVVQHYNAKQLKRLFERLGYKIIIQGQFGKEYYGYNERLFIQVCKGSLS